MNRHYKTKIKILIFYLCIITISNMFYFPVNATSEKSTTIRVGYPIQEGLTMLDEKNYYSGYTYDYLMEISQYTGWKYDFVTVEGSINEQIIKLMDMLKTGEIDILSALYYDESLADIYAYSSYSYGNNHMGIFVPHDSKLRETSLYNFGNIKIGVYNKLGQKNEKLQQYGEMNNIVFEQIVADSSEQFYNLIKTKQVDALLSTDLAMAPYKDYYSIARFSPMPFYFATTKGNTELVKKLNYVIPTIRKVNPNFSNEIYEKYFAKNESDVFLSEDEKIYLKTKNTLEVVMYNNKPPFQYIDSKTRKPAGISIEILNIIAEKIGFKLNYNAVSNYSDYIDYIKSGKADITTELLVNYQDAQDTQTLLTLPWCEFSINVLFKKKNSLNKSEKIAVPYYLKNIIPETKNIFYYTSASQCLNGMKKGVIDTLYIDEFCGQYYINAHEYSNLINVSLSNIKAQKFCFGVCNTNNLDLLVILNKGIFSLSKEKVNEIIYQNTYVKHEVDLKLFLKLNKNWIIVIFMSAIIFILIISFYNKNHEQQKADFEIKRHNAISNLANEYFYEYNLVKDKLLLSEKCANYFQCEQTILNFSEKIKNAENDSTGIWYLGNYIVNNNKGSFEISCELPDHSRQWFKIISSNIKNKNNQIYAVGKITNIQEMKSEQIRLEKKASIDSLTGIYNISAISKLIKNHLDNFDKTTQSAFIILDIDNFKEINDNFGHYRGDYILMTMAEILKNIFPIDLTGRLGGDEFIIFLKDTTKEELAKKCQILCKEMVNKTIEILGKPFSCSVGITMVKEAKSYNELYQEADKAMYTVKQLNKNGYSFYKG